ncbi:MAG: type II toxin-antitoxin system VapC family toxin [Gemmatimonadetes bacterium]|nr:type II toxin-antitoxin system VapC family toxin [Gemmatimonadota bacterium]
MIFWDTSAVIPLIIDEPNTEPLRAVWERDSGMVVWWGTSVECASALARVGRDGIISARQVDVARDLLQTLASSWTEVLPTDGVREHAGRLLLRHPLRAADALQIGAAMIWADDRPTGHPFCTLGARLADVARLEGFRAVDVMT